MLKDFRFSLRLLLRQPGFTLIAVLTLALGIGATSAVFSLIQGVLLTPPPYRQPGRLVLIPAARTDGHPDEHAPGWAAAQWLNWQAQAKSFESIAAYGWTFNFLIGNDGSESIEGMWVTHDYFSALGLQPILGRSFLESETGATAKPVIVLGYDFWQRTFHADPHIVGKTIHLSRQDTPPTVIGVMPPGVRFLPSPSASQEPNYDLNGHVDYWVPARVDPQHLKSRYWNVIGRMKPGVSLSQAQAELATLGARQGQADRDLDGFTPHLESLTDELNRDGDRILLPLLCAAALVLLIACGNVAALLLMRGLQRQQEYAIRSALGIGRAGLLRQVFAEGLLLAMFGGVLGVGLAFGVVKLLKAIAGHAIPRLDAVTTGWVVLLCGLGSAVLAAVLAAAFPALRASSLDPIAILKSAGPKSSAGRGERRLLRGVTMVQTALTLALLVGTGLLVRTMLNLSQVSAGYRTSHILTATVTAVQGDWNSFHRMALERVSAIPGVEKAAFAWGVPLTGNDWPGALEIEGQPPAAKASDKILIPLRSVTPGYFSLLGQTITRGRDFLPSDTAKTGDAAKTPDVAIVNQALVDRYFPHADPIGKKIWFFDRQGPGNEIVGVVTNTRTDDLTRAPDPEVYLCFWQAHAFSKSLVVQTSADPRAVAGAIERELRSVDPTVAIENVKTLDQIRSDSLASRTFAMQLLVGFSLVGSILTLVGIYGVLTLSVASRRREIAIRAAVGAGRHDLRKLVFTEGLRLVAGGVAAGIVAALLLSRVLQSFLFGVGATDPATFLIVGILFAAVALLACWVPVRRAAAVDPIEALRYE
ncbi:MAG TPA: ABC transporter permease [Bryobacteraceae bacterium]|nr:ABC transporter permease [Bryobacteraceae bacterium]